MIYNESFTVVLDDLSEYIDTHNKHLLKEDMLQLVYKNYIIDVGFYSKGFVLYVVKDHNWDVPMRKELIPQNDIINRISKACVEVLSIGK